MDRGRCDSTASRQRQLPTAAERIEDSVCTRYRVPTFTSNFSFLPCLPAFLFHKISNSSKSVLYKSFISLRFTSFPPLNRIKLYYQCNYKKQKQQLAFTNAGIRTNSYSIFQCEEKRSAFICYFTEHSKLLAVTCGRVWTLSEQTNMRSWVQDLRVSNSIFSAICPEPIPLRGITLLTV